MIRIRISLMGKNPDMQLAKFINANPKIEILNTYKSKDEILLLIEYNPVKMHLHIPGNAHIEPQGIYHGGELLVSLKAEKEKIERQIRIIENEGE